ncbi:MAG TPA: methyltransferase [Candidatus Saccharimonadia bacterium]|nr:methyltransferase [Candidatus Saccharimonadia bacterium]
MKRNLLVLALVAALAACGDDADDADEVATTPAADAAAVPAAAPVTVAATPATPATPAASVAVDPAMQARIDARAQAATSQSAPAAGSSATGKLAPATDAASFATKLDRVLGGDHRSEANRARDVYRHPKETLAFFGLKPGDRVVEISPGAGWYTEVLAPLMRGNGKLVAAIPDDTIEGQPKYRYDVINRFKTLLWSRPDVYDQVEVELFTPPTESSLGAPGSADVVLTFRNVHNWIGDKSAPAVFKAAFDVLKPGGVLGVTEHRAAAGKSAEESFKSGYLSEESVIKLATDAGFTLAAKSEVNANPKDTKDYAEGVWTLPPTLKLGDADREKYLAIGESDRMTLKFVKPVK